ncbi:WW domain protein [Oesophagostomum dentatum]|uniref:WW domain protein n=1 Tax=Oesophagostomum dentatum TaxID=61180 RepID=A0A0B1TNN9_OESDE|nr:WW domain protein [Oesophagostomum dentatum]
MLRPFLVFPPAPPFPEFGPYPTYPVPEVLGIPASYECVQPPVDEFDVEECRRYYESYDVISLQQRLQSLQKEMSVVQSLLDQRIENKRPTTPPTVAPKTPPLPKTPPPPPPLKEYLWRKAVDEDGAKYYYHKITRESVWELPEGEESDPGERTPTRMPDTSGCGNDPESDTAETSKHKNDILTRWSGLCSPQVSTSTTAQSATPSSSQPVCNGTASVDGTQSASQKKRDRERHLWQRFSSDADRKRAKKLMDEIEKVVGPIIIHHIGQREDATKKRKEWIIKQVSKEMLKRESDRPDFNFTLTEKGSKRVTDYASAFIRRKCAKEPKELWKGYSGSP